MAICVDCIQQVGFDTIDTGGSIPCSGLTVTVESRTGPTTISPTVVANTFSLTGYDIYFSIDGYVYYFVKAGSEWLLIDKDGVKLFSSLSTGTENDTCPPRDGWTDLNSGPLVGLTVDYRIDPGPSENCANSNGTFDTDLSGWADSNFTWDASIGGSARYDTNLIGYLEQSVLVVGETYKISFDYYAPAYRDLCSPSQYAEGYIKVYAGSNVYTTEINNTYLLAGGYKRVEVELTCEVTTVLRIEIKDTNDCFTTVSGYKGVYIDNVCALRLTNVTNPTGESLLKKFIDPAEVPLQLNKKDYNTVLESYQDCLARKGTTLYNKISGGVKCDDRELQKLKLIIGLLNQKDEDRSLDCIYDRASVITAVYQELPTGSIGTLTEGDTEIVVDGDLSTFETFIFHITAPVDFSTTIVDAVYDSVTDTTTIILGDEIPSNIVGASYAIEFESENDNTYLKTFTDFANRFCADCIGTGYPSRVTTPTTSTPEQFEIQPTELKTESGIPITTEYNQKITI